MKEVDSYKYLGIDQEKMKGWKKYVERMVKKARSRIGELSMIGVKQTGLRPSTGKQLIEVLLRPLLEYGYEVTILPKYQQHQIEQQMMKAGRAITGLPWNGMGVAVRGELGWRTMEERSEVAKMKYFQHLRTLPQTRLIKRIFDIRMDDANKQWNAQRVKRSWCHVMRKIMDKYGIAEEWKKEKDERNNVTVNRWWNGNGEEKGVKEKVEKKQEEEWKKEVKEKTKGQYYMKCKKEWGEEEYLNEEGDRKGRVWKARMRASAAPLAAILKSEHGRGKKSSRCMVCGEVNEDQKHMLLVCDGYTQERETMMAEIAAVVDPVEWKRLQTSDDLDTWLLSSKEVDTIVKHFLNQAWTIRNFHIPKEP